MKYLYCSSQHCERKNCFGRQLYWCITHNIYNIYKYIYIQCINKMK